MMKIRHFSVLLIYITACTVMSVSPTMLGLPRIVHAQTENYKPAVPVVDYIEKERPQKVESREIKDIEEARKGFEYLLSQEFLAALLSFLILFLVLYVYLRYMRGSSRPKIKYKKHKKRFGEKHVTKTKKISVPPLHRREEQKNDTGDSTEKEEISDVPVSDMEEFQLHEDKKNEIPLFNKAENMKTERMKHSHRINKLLEKL